MQLQPVTRCLPLALALALSLASCATTVRQDEFATWSAAGVAYADQLVLVLEASADAALDADSLSLIRARELAGPTETALDAGDERMRKHLSLIRDLQGLARAQRDYMVLLGRLAGSTAGRDLKVELDQTFERLSGFVKPELTERLAEFTEPVPLIVRSFQVAALEAELKERAPALRRIMKLQAELLAVLAEQAAVDVQALANFEYGQSVEAPYLDPRSALSRTWIRNRRELLKANAILPALQATQIAAARYAQAFDAVLSSGFERSQVVAVLQDLEATVELLEALRNRED